MAIVYLLLHHPLPPPMNNNQALTRVNVKAYLNGRGKVVYQGNIKTENHSDESQRHPNYEPVRLQTAPAILSHHHSTNHDSNNTIKLETSNRININKPEVTFNRMPASSILHVEVKFRLN